MSDTADATSAVQARFPSAVVRASADHPAFTVPASEAIEVLRFLKQEQGFDFLCDVTAIDWSASASPRFTVVWHLYSTTQPQYIRIAANCENDIDPEMATATVLWPAADWHERETWDLMGVRFVGHPDLRRILMWDGYPYHPLRKDFPLAGLPTELPDEEIAEYSGTKVIPAPMAGGPFVAQPDGSVHTSTGRGPRSLDQAWNEKKEKPAD